MATQDPSALPVTSLEEHPFLDPLEPAKIQVDGRVYLSAESLFLASSFISNKIWDEFQAYDGPEAREAYNRLWDAKEPQRPSFMEKTTEVTGSVPGYMELLRRTLVLKYQQNPELLKQLLATKYRPIKLVINPSGTPSNWLSDVHLNATLVIVRYQLREWQAPVLPDPSDSLGELIDVKL